MIERVRTGNLGRRDDGLVRERVVERIQELARLDTQLLTVLDAGRLLTDAEWQELTQSRVGS